MVSPLNPTSSGIRQTAPEAASPRSDRSNNPKAQSSQPEVTTTRRIVTAEDGIAILRQRLEERLQSFDVKVSRPAMGEFERPSATQVANRILGFVEARLAREQAGGADPERLKNLLDQAREGVTRGFSEAREQIEALGMMTGELAEGISDSFTRVTEGLDRLADRMSVAEAPMLGASAVGVNYERASRQQLSFEVVTREGDRVTVSMDERSYQSGTLAGAESGVSTMPATSDQKSFAGRYTFSVEGELDRGEMKALTELFEGAQSVSERFFSGDVLGAFEEVQTLDLNSNELASYSLNLSYARASRVTSYADVTPQPASRLAPLGDLAGGLRDLSDKAERANVAPPQLLQLMELMVVDAKQRSGASVSEPVESLMNRFWQSVITQLAEDRGVGGGSSEESIG